jgi:transposase
MGLEMSESFGIDSPFWGWGMPKSCSTDLRERVIEAVEMGASRHEAADRFEVSVSSAVKWHQRWRVWVPDNATARKMRIAEVRRFIRTAR